MIPELLTLVKHFEGFYSRPYLCPGGVWTLGWGTTRYPNGRRVTAQSAPCTREQAEMWMVYELEGCQRSVDRYCRVELNEYQRAALTSFVYNLGSGAFRASTLRRRINTGDFDDVPYQMRRWNKAGGRVLTGLKRRRNAEVRLWETHG